ncbi:MAG: hypothetical protein DDT40_01758 [candidate division WS2 bacterium]|nr:hypothetical protein [Candidatus Psychracetigena formicireducens]
MVGGQCRPGLCRPRRDQAAAAGVFRHRRQRRDLLRPDGWLAHGYGRLGVPAGHRVEPAVATHRHRGGRNLCGAPGGPSGLPAGGRAGPASAGGRQGSELGHHGIAGFPGNTRQGADQNGRICHYPGAGGVVRLLRHHPGTHRLDGSPAGESSGLDQGGRRALAAVHPDDRHVGEHGRTRRDGLRLSHRHGCRACGREGGGGAGGGRGAGGPERALHRPGDHAGRRPGGHLPLHSLGGQRRRQGVRGRGVHRRSDGRHLPGDRSYGGCRPVR